MNGNFEGVIIMKDDSSLNSGSPKKSGVDRAKTLFSDSFRLAASVMGSNTGSSRAQHLNLPSTCLSIQTCS